MFVVLRRDDVNDVNFAMTWQSPVSYLMLDRPLGLYINDETSVDSPGADEVYLDIWLDSTRAFDGYWDDADTDETWPGLAAAITQQIRAQMPAVGNRVASASQSRSRTWRTTSPPRAGRPRFCSGPHRKRIQSTYDARFPLRIPSVTACIRSITR